MIEARGLTKRYGDTLAVDDLSFTVEPGKVTGFLGPNGAGKTTTMRMILGPGPAHRGPVTVNGEPLPASWRTRCARSARCWTPRRCTAAAAPTTTCSAWPRPTTCPGGGWTRCSDLVGLTAVAGKRSKGFSLGMGQRLGIAAALLGDPEILMFDEPVNGLDPEGILWIRNLMKALAAEGRTVFVSSHLMSRDGEHRRPPDRDRPGQAHRRLHDGGVHRRATRGRPVRVRTPQPEQLARLVAAAGGTVARRRRRRADGAPA